MGRLITPAFIDAFKNYPLYSQEGAADPLVIAKLFNAFGSGTWYLLEYDVEQQIAFGYVTGLGHDEFGYASIAELESIMLPNTPVPCIERDEYFTQRPLRYYVDLPSSD